MKIAVNTQPSYFVNVENGMLDRVGYTVAQLMKQGTKIMIVSESNVFPLYGKRLENSLAESGFCTYRFVFEAGEQSKTLQTVYKIYEKLAESGFTRTDLVLALGGGVTGDMAGFAAATFLRGMRYIQVPSSLLAQVDASVGGKTGVDIPDFGKNLVGAFHQPLCVLTDPELLKTLPSKHIKDGMAEVIKYGCISDASLFKALDSGELTRQDMMIENCIKIKVDFVVEDTLDTGRRMILNFGHTFGHALEKLHNYSGLMHGEAVAIGMVIAASIGERLNITKAGTADKIRNMLELYGLPYSQEFSAGELMQASFMDKKNDGNIINLILLRDIGDAVIHKISRQELSIVLTEILEGDDV